MNIAGFSEFQKFGYVGKLLNKSFLNSDLLRQISNFSEKIFFGCGYI